MEASRWSMGLPYGVRDRANVDRGQLDGLLQAASTAGVCDVDAGGTAETWLGIAARAAGPAYTRGAA
jgi:hypothetical protein